MILSADQLYALAFEHFQAGRLPPAAACLEALVPHPAVGPEALNLLAVICARRGDLGQSAAHLARLVAARPLVPEYRSNLVTTLERAGHLPAAIEAANDWATALYKNKRWPEAAEALRRVLQLAPDHRPARCNLAACCEALGRPEESIAIGLSLLRTYGPHDAATADLVRAVDRALPDLPADPTAPAVAAAAARQPAVGPADLEDLLPKALCNLGNSLARLRLCDLSIRAYRRSQQLVPAPLTEWNLALVLLLAGRFDEGWRAYEARWRADDFEFPQRGFSQPRWQGEPLAGRSILVYAEQGFGDTFQFCRFVPQLLDQTAAVAFEVPRELHALLRNSFRGLPIRVIPRVDDPRRLAEPVSFDVHCGLMSLVRLLGRDMADLAAAQPYLLPGDGARAYWRGRLPPAPRARVGIVWAGRPEHYKDKERSIGDAALLRPLAAVPGIEWHSLQLGPAAVQRSAFCTGCIDHGAELADFDRTAALIEHLDAVVTVDTAVAHVAGGLGKPVYLLLPYACDWRWQLDRDDTPWYPAVRLYRQVRRGDWTAPVAALAAALASSLPACLEAAAAPRTPAVADAAALVGV